MESTQPVQSGRGHGFGTMPVFLAAISTILGAIMFLRFGFAVANVGLLGAILIVVLGHMVTVPTALATAEIATNRRVEGGGVYFIISRSFGTTIGGVIGIALFFSQAISVAFYVIAFAEAFRPLAPLLESAAGIDFDPRLVSLPTTVMLLAIVYFRGAGGGVRLLYAVVVILALALAAFLFGDPIEGFDSSAVTLTTTVKDPVPFFVVFAICFPAFTGMAAGVGLSGDLANPRRSIPLGTMAATLTGLVVYLAVVIKLAFSAPLETLGSDQLVMARIALSGPIILLGLGAATLSSAIGSILIAPRTLQALGADNSLPSVKANHWLSRGVGSVNEPRNATLVTGLLALVTVMLGSVDFVARIISMFFMVTYGALCAISFLEHFAARPSYRPGFRSRWYVSLFGALMSLLMMLQMDPVYATLSIVIMVGLYQWLRRHRGRDADDLAAMFEGVMTQATRHLNVRLQSKRPNHAADEWRPSVIMVNSRTFDRRTPLMFMRWLCHRYGFGTYLHHLPGTLNEESFAQSRQIKQQLVELARQQKTTVYMDTIVSPSMVSALAQSLQVPGVSGLNNNTAMFEFSVYDDPSVVAQTAEYCLFAASARMSLLVLRHGGLHFGERRTIHLWLTWNDAENANMMILLSYILVGHEDWGEADIRVFVALPGDRVEERRQEFMALIAEGRMPVSELNIRFMPVDDIEAFRSAVVTNSASADLTVFGFDLEGLKERHGAVFANHPGLRDVLFVHSPQAITIR